MIALLRNSSTARVAKLVDALVSGARAARCGGSNPFPGTKWLDNPATFFIFFIPCLQFIQQRLANGGSLPD